MKINDNNSYPSWSEDEINFLKDNFIKLTNEELSQKLKRTVGAVARKKYSLMMTKSMKWDRQNVIERLKFLYNNLGHSPTSREINMILYQACLRYFGSFNEAKIEAGLTITEPKYFNLPHVASSMSTDFAYVLGASLGDAHIETHPGRKGVTLNVRDKDFALVFMTHLEKWSEKTPYFHLDKEGFYIVRTYSKEIAEFIKEFNLEDVLSAPMEIKRYFLKGLFDSEGSVGISNLDIPRKASRHIGFYNSNKNLIRITHKVLKQLNIKHHINTRIHSGFGSKKTQYEIIITGFRNISLFKKLVGFSIKRKEDKLDILLRSYVRYNNEV